MAIDDGGSAFPRIDVEHFPSGYGHGEHCETQSKAGMSLRDWFAGQALAGVITHPHATDGSPEQCAAVAYDMADAMIAASRRTGEA